MIFASYELTVSALPINRLGIWPSVVRKLISSVQKRAGLTGEGGGDAVVLSNLHGLG